MNDVPGEGIDWERAILGNVGERVYVFDADYTFRFVDRRVSEFDDLSREELQGRDLTHLADIGVLTPAEVARIEDGIDRVFAGETDATDVEVQPAVPEGTGVVEVRLTPVDSPAGTEFVLATARDVSRRKRRERKLERYETIVEVIDDAAFVIADDWTVAYANQSAVDNAGLSLGEVQGEAVLPLVEQYAAAADGPDRFAEALERAFDADDPMTFSERIELTLGVDGEELTFEYQFSPIVENGAVEAVAVTGRDVTARKERERKLEALHEATRNLMIAESRAEIAEIVAHTARDILDLPINGVYLQDEEENVLSPVSITGEAVDIVDEPPVFPPGESLAWDVFESGEMAQFHDVSTVSGRYNEDTPIRSELILPLGEYGVLLVGSTAIGAFDETDVSMARVLAANAEAAMARADRERELARQNERLGEFASIVSHDLRNPLQVASGRLELFREVRDDEHLDAAEGALDRMERLIDDLLRLAREGEAVEDLQAVELAALCESCWENVETADATLVVDTERTIRADPGRLQQLLENLMRNAVEHGGTDVTIEVGDLDRGFYVADDGPGIHPGERDSVFEAGYSTTEDGTGFGLSIVGTIADAHGWNVRVTDGADGGARFEIRGVDVES